jgi:hypothetical protein
MPHAVRAEACHERREQRKQRQATSGDHNGLPICKDTVTPDNTNCSHDFVIIRLIRFSMLG